MIKNIMLVALAYWAYTQYKTSQAAQADRNALLSILTPAQQATLLNAVQSVASAAGTVAQGAASGAATAAANMMTPTAGH
jgi:hypothetical protein